MINEVFQDLSAFTQVSMIDETMILQGEDNSNSGITLEPMFNGMEGCSTSMNVFELISPPFESASIGVNMETVEALNLDSLIRSTIGEDSELFSLLDEIEDSNKKCDDNEEVKAVENDHIYSVLPTIEVKPNESKKQAIRRVKNNVASKVCRKQRKNRFQTMCTRADELLQKNHEIRNRIVDVESVVNILKDNLVKAMAQRSC